MDSIAKINTNIAALRAFDTLSEINRNINKTQERIATGKIINSPADSPASYFVSKQLARDINTLSRKNKNTERAINYLQTTNSKLIETVDILLEMSDLANQANSSSITSAEKAALQVDITQLRDEIDDILQSGIDSQIYTGFTVGGLENVSLSGTGSNSLPTLASLTIDGTNIDVTGANVTTSITNIDNAYDLLLRDQEKLGSFIRRLEFEAEVQDAEKTDTESSLSTVQDADLAEQELQLAKYQILQQTALSMFAQANANPQRILQIFTGSSAA